VAVQWRQIAVGAGHRRRVAQSRIAGVVGGIVGHAGMLADRSGTGPAARGGRAANAGVITSTPGHTPILAHGWGAGVQPIGVAGRPRTAAASGTMDGVTARTEEAAITEWPEEVAALLTGAVGPARAAIEEFSRPESVGDSLGGSYEDRTAATRRFLAHLPG